MHTYHSDEHGVTINYNGSRTGEAIVTVKERPEIEEMVGPDGVAYYSFRMPCEPLAQFSRWSVLSEVTSVLEEMQ